jgi:hypothetical protein
MPENTSILRNIRPLTSSGIAVDSLAAFLPTADFLAEAEVLAGAGFLAVPWQQQGLTCPLF